MFFNYWNKKELCLPRMLYRISSKNSRSKKFRQKKIETTFDLIDGQKLPFADDPHDIYICIFLFYGYRRTQTPFYDGVAIKEPTIYNPTRDG